MFICLVFTTSVIFAQFGFSEELGHFTNEGSSCTNEYQEYDKIWPICVYWKEENYFLTEFATNSTNSRNIESVNKAK